MTDELYNGMSYHDESRNVLYWRGDGAYKSVVLPHGKRVDTIIPFHSHTFEVADDETPIVTFDRALDVGVLVKILMRDNP